MKYILMMHAPRGTGDYQISEWSSEELEALDGDPRFADHYRLDAVRGHLLEMTGDIDRAAACFRAAADRTASIPERDYLRLKAARLGSLEL